MARVEYHVPFHHNDPFDRLLMAQAIIEGIPIVSGDPGWIPTRSSGSASNGQMNVVTDYLFGLIAKQVADRGLVVWYDPKRAYMQALAELALRKTTIGRYPDNFFRLRPEIDPLLNDSQPPVWSSTCPCRVATRTVP